jgi:tetratricopeptide (TPR) repeat protein
VRKQKAPAHTDRSQSKLRQPKNDSKSKSVSTPRHSSLNDKKFLLKWRDVYAFLPAGLALLTSLNTVYNGFVHDDLPQILNNPFTQDIANLPLAFTGSVWSVFSDNIRAAMDVYYRPLFNMLLILNYALFGSSAWAWHLINVVIHASVSLLVFIVVKEISGRQWLSLITACLFAVHPTHVESVAWISGVTDPLMSLFFLTALLFYLRYRMNGRVLMLIAALVSYLLSLLSKETAAALPLVLCFLELTNEKTGWAFSKRAQRTLIVLAIFAIPTGLYFFLRYSAIGNVLIGTAHVAYPLGTALLTVPIVIAKYLWLLSVPFGYNFQHYTALVDSPSEIRFLAPFALIICLTVAVVLINSKMVKLGAIWFIAALAPVMVASRFLHPISLVQERYLYLPSIGFCLVLAVGIEWIWSHRNGMGRLIAALLLLVVGVGWSWVTVEQNQTWRNTITLFQRCVIANPRSPLARTALSTAYHVGGKKQEAEGEARRALDLDSTCIDAYVNLAYFARSSGNLDDAIDYLKQALSTINDDPEKLAYRGILHHDLGLVYEESKDFDSAEQNLRKAIEYRPSVPNIYDLGGFYFDRGQYERALELYEDTFRRINPRFFGVIYLKLARTYDKLGQPEKARPAYEKYLELHPNAKERTEVLRRLSQL